ncbi:MAG: polyprenol monophosphomannose synthase [Elusimicrobia bacterium]|nr:polyprenol monophosphomannose synthase [Elusimicrobiota bacterium]
MRARKTVVMVPTYDEAQNIEALIRELLALRIEGLEVLVVDDRSPDGTAEIVSRLAALESRVKLLRREGPKGRGLAGRDGYLKALELGAERVVEMDADFSHQPKHIPALLAGLERGDLIIGSRLIVGGSDRDRPLARRWLTVAANAYARLLLGLPVEDTNSGFRAFSRKALETVSPQTLRSAGPAILHETLYRARRAGLRLLEVPIEFVDRKKGESKLDLRRLAAGYLTVLKIAIIGD